MVVLFGLSRVSPKDDAMKDITITIPGELLRHALETLQTADAKTPPPRGSAQRPTPANDVRRGPVPHDHQSQDQDWTDKQKRLIYRLCYDRGFTGEDAKRFIRTRVGLPQGNGRPPSMREASDLIDQLMSAEQEGGGHGAA